MKLQDVITFCLCLFVCTSFVLSAANKNDKDARAIRCQNHLKDLHAASLGYANANENYLPDGVNTKKRPWGWWYKQIPEYVKDFDSFYCPEKYSEYFENNKAKDPLIPNLFDVAKVSYGYNYKLSSRYSKGIRYKVSDIENPQMLILLGESNYYLIRATKWGWKKDVPVRHQQKTNFITVGGSVLFEDPQLDSYPQKNGKGILNLKHWRF